MTEGTSSVRLAERSTAPHSSRCTTSAFSRSTSTTARCRESVVSGSYVALSNRTWRIIGPLPVAPVSKGTCLGMSWLFVPPGTSTQPSHGPPPDGPADGHHGTVLSAVWPLPLRPRHPLTSGPE